MGSSEPRRIEVDHSLQPVLAFTMVVGRLGLRVWVPVLLTASPAKGYLSGCAPTRLLTWWRKEVGNQLICEIELLSVVATCWMFQSRFMNRRVLRRVDNSAAWYSLTKGTGPSRSMQLMVSAFYRLRLRRTPGLSECLQLQTLPTPEEACALLGARRGVCFPGTDVGHDFTARQLVVKRG